MEKPTTILELVQTDSDIRQAIVDYINITAIASLESSLERVDADKEAYLEELEINVTTFNERLDDWVIDRPQWIDYPLKSRLVFGILTLLEYAVANNIDVGSEVLSLIIPKIEPMDKTDE